MCSGAADPTLTHTPIVPACIFYTASLPGNTADTHTLAHLHTPLQESVMRNVTVLYLVCTQECCHTSKAAKGTIMACLDPLVIWVFVSGVVHQIRIHLLWNSVVPVPWKVPLRGKCILVVLHVPGLNPAGCFSVGEGYSPVSKYFINN